MTDPRIQADSDEAAASFGFRWENGRLVRDPSPWVCVAGSNDVNLALQIVKKQHNSPTVNALDSDVKV